MRLLLPEWQGYGLGTEVSHGARALAAEWFAGHEVVTIDAPVDEVLTSSEGVLGLHSIAPRFAHTLNVIRTMRPDRLLMIGGTCGVELAPIAYLNERYNAGLAVLWLDAHADLNTPASSPSGHFHGMALRSLLGDGPRVCTGAITRPLTHDQVFLVGARDLDPPEQDFVRDHAIPVLPDDAFRDPPILTTMLKNRGWKRLYVHFDVDVLNPDGFPASLMHAPGGGPTLAEAATLLRALHANFDVVGFSVLEFCERDDWARELGMVLRAIVNASSRWS